MGEVAVVMVKKDKLKKLPKNVVVDLLDIDGRRTYTFPCDLRRRRSVVRFEDVDECYNEIVSEIIEIVMSGDEEEKRHLKELLNQFTFAKKLRDTLLESDAVIIWESATRELCDYLDKGYIPVTSVLCTEDGKEETRWIREMCENT